MTIRARDFVKQAPQEGLKFYIAYDGSNRMEYVYEATVDSAHGSPCLVTQYSYIGATTRVEKMKESKGTWDSSWDLT